MVFVLSVFFPFFLLFFLFYWYFLWQTLTIQTITRMGEGILIFLVFQIHPLINISLVHRDFFTFLHRLICNYQADSWWNSFSLGIFILFAFSLMQLSQSYLLLYFKVTWWGFEVISKLSHFYYKVSALTNWYWLP